MLSSLGPVQTYYAVSIRHAICTQLVLRNAHCMENLTLLSQPSSHSLTGLIDSSCSGDRRLGSYAVYLVANVACCTPMCRPNDLGVPLYVCYSYLL